MGFVLIGVTNGDELIRSREVLIAESESRDRLETLSKERSESRAKYLREHGDEIPWFQMESVYSREYIKEVPTV